jgi:hypothetical protein
MAKKTSSANVGLTQIYNEVARRADTSPAAPRGPPARYVRPECRCRPDRACRVPGRVSGLRSQLPGTLKNDAARRIYQINSSLNGRDHWPARR